MSLMVLVLLALGACGDVSDDLLPSGSDKRPDVQEGVTGSQVGEVAPDFTVPDAFGEDFTLSAALPTARAVVLYFTMWCPICDSHLSHLNGSVVPLFPDVAFYVVDYVSGSVADARSLQTSHGFAQAGFSVLVDLGNVVEDLYGGTMATTVVIDGAGVVRMNEDYKDGSRLVQALSALP